MGTIKYLPIFRKWAGGKWADAHLFRDIGLSSSFYAYTQDVFLLPVCWTFVVPLPSLLYRQIMLTSCPLFADTRASNPINGIRPDIRELLARLSSPMIKQTVWLSTTFFRVENLVWILGWLALFSKMTHARGFSHFDTKLRNLCRASWKNILRLTAIEKKRS